MSEGLTSIEDLKVVITAETEKFAAGLGNAQELLARFSTGGTGSLGLVDAALGKLGDGVGALQGKIGVWLTVAQTFASFAAKLGAEGEKLGKALGEEQRVNALKEAVSDLGDAVQEGVAGAFKNATGALAMYALGLADAGDSTATNVNTMKLHFQQLATTAEEALKYASQGLRNLKGEDATDAGGLTKQVEHLKAHIVDIVRLRDEVAAGKGGWLDWLSDANIERYNAMLAEMAVRLADIMRKRDDAVADSKAGWSKNITAENEHSEKAISGLEKEARALRQQAEARLMAAGAAAEYLARMKALNAIDDAGGTPMKSDVSRINAQAAEVGRLKQREQDEKDAEAAEDEAERQSKRAEQAVQRIRSEIDAIEGRRRALLDTSLAAAIEIEQTKTLNDLKKAGVAEGSAEAIEALALAARRASATREFDELKRSLDSLRQYGDSVAKSLEGAFRQWANGAKVDGREMVRSLLVDLAMLSFKQSVTQPLSGGIQSALGGILGAVFGGARADGGPVVAGETYLVGERGPELFTASNSGTIVANDQLRTASQSQQPQQIVQHVHINAAGAYPESMEEIKRALADANSRLPGRVLEVVSDARERGGLG